MMKRFIISMMTVLALGYVGLQTVNAQGWYGDGPGPGYGRGHDCQSERCWNCSSGPNYRGELSKEEQAARDKFFTDTEGLRKQLAEKKAMKHALMRQDNPDEKKAAQLAGEIFDLKSTLHKKAEEAGIKHGFGAGGWGCDGEGCRMQGGRHGGRGKHRMMREW